MRLQGKGKIAVIGCGRVGMTILRSLILRSVGNRYILIDKLENQSIIEAEISDLEDVMVPFHPYLDIFFGTYSDLDSVDIIIIAAGAAQKRGQSRTALLTQNFQVIKSIIQKINTTNFSGSILLVTNPCDVLAYCVAKISSLPPSKILATGTLLDSHRYRIELAKELRINNLNLIDAFVLGEHGRSSVIIKSASTIKHLPLKYLLKKGEYLTLEQFGSIEQTVIEKAKMIINQKGWTDQGIGAAATVLVRKLLCPEDSFSIASVLLQGEYGMKNVFLGVPVILGQGEIKEIIEWELDEEEQRALEISAARIKDLISGIEDLTV